MTAINIPTPTACNKCPFKGERWCYMAIWLRLDPKDVPEEGKPDWCPLIDLSAYEDDGK